ncbi:hypothetical protein [Flavisphingomonas formosensis]|uniref:hypothetical protein n=1 Tax=Flavisphingomonas formosensis TaxID=861534 RepID=UPI0012F916B6|nr:hypothetical protein [Sphingomonas formosensis]
MNIVSALFAFLLATSANAPSPSNDLTLFKGTIEGATLINIDYGEEGQELILPPVVIDLYLVKIRNISGIRINDHAVIRVLMHGMPRSNVQIYILARKQPDGELKIITWDFKRNGICIYSDLVEEENLQIIFQDVLKNHRSILRKSCLE